MQYPTMAQFWDKLNRAREVGNSPAAFAAARAIRAASRQNSLPADAVAWYLLAEYELANPSPVVPAAATATSEPEQENTATV